MRCLRFFLPALALGAALGCTSPSRGYCAAAAECDEREAVLDPVGEDNDSLEVCVANQDGFLRTLRANEEQRCQDAANAWEAYMACVAQVYAEDEGDACDGFRGGVLNGLLGNSSDNPCEDELTDFGEIAQDLGDDCSPNEE